MQNTRFEVEQPCVSVVRNDVRGLFVFIDSRVIDNVLFVACSAIKCAVTVCSEDTDNKTTLLIFTLGLERRRWTGVNDKPVSILLQ